MGSIVETERKTQAPFMTLFRERLDYDYLGNWGAPTAFAKVRDAVRLASDDYIDLPVYEPAMRHLT